MQIHFLEIPSHIKASKIYPWTMIRNKSTEIPVELSHDASARLQEDLQRLVKSCVDNGGVGLAAPQIGLFRRFIVCQSLDHYTYQAYINPSFKPNHDKGTNTEQESCLSVPNKSFSIRRYNEITVEYHEVENLKLVKKQKTLEGYSSRVFQHELDHLNGISIPDRFKLQKKKQRKPRKKKRK